MSEIFAKIHCIYNFITIKAQILPKSIKEYMLFIIKMRGNSPKIVIIFSFRKFRCGRRLVLVINYEGREVAEMMWKLSKTNT